MIDEFGLLVGSEILLRLECGLEVSRCRLLVIFMSDIVSMLSVLESLIMVLLLVSVLNLLGVDLNLRFVFLESFVVKVLVKLGVVLRFVLIVVLFWVSWSVCVCVLCM